MATSVERGKVGDAAGFARLLARVNAEAPRVVVVGLPLETYDERFTSKLAGGADAQAAAHLLADWLRWRQAR
jgi:RNase H-fold protein (predicted Holliday junction resolvase)